MSENFKKMILCSVVAILFGCQDQIQVKRKPVKYAFPETEVAWIREGEPIEFEGELWYPTDSMEILLDKEVYLLGEYQGVEFFVDKADVKPYNRLYTKFHENKFRAFRKKRNR